MGSKETTSQDTMFAIKEQLLQYQQKVELSAQSFSVNELAETLQEISRKTQQKPIHSIYGLRSFVENTQSSKENANGVSLEREVMYATWFLENLTYLKGLKSQFDDRIYLPLTQMFHGERPLGQRQSSAHSTDSWSVLLFKDQLPEIKELYNNADLENVISRLRYLKNRLDHLLEDDGEIDPALFSVTSARVLEDLRLPNNAFMRFMPDIQQKMGTAAILAERWLEIITSKDASGSTMVSKLERVKTMLSERLDILNNEISKMTEELSVESDDLQDLLAQEDRSDLISNKCQSLEVKFNKLSEKISQNVKQISDIKELVNTAAGNSQFKDQLNADLTKKIKLHDELTRSAKILEYEKNLTTDDLRVELEMKPSLIRFTNSLQDKCEELENSLEAKQLEKHQLEMALRPAVKELRRLE